MAKEKNGDRDDDRKLAPVIELRPDRLQKKTPDEELRWLINELRACVTSAQTISTRGSAREKTRELNRLRRMLTAWEGFRVEEAGANGVDARMHFVDWIFFFSRICRNTDDGVDPRSRSQALTTYAKQVIAKIDSLAPAAARRLDVALVKQAIDRWTRRHDWKAIIRAWGTDDTSAESASAESCRTQWAAWKRRKK